MAVIQTILEREIIECIHNRGGCIYFDPDVDGPVQRKLNKDKSWNPIVWWIYTGASYNPGNGLKPIPFQTQIHACKKHEDILIERGGWDGTGQRQK